MTNSVNQVNYDILTQIAKQLHSESEEHTQLNAQTRQRMDALQGGWQGDAAKAFFSEMNGTVLPASQRLVGALQAGESVLNQIMQIIHQADEETASYFKGTDGTPHISIIDQIKAIPLVTDGISLYDFMRDKIRNFFDIDNTKINGINTPGFHIPFTDINIPGIHVPFSDPAEATLFALLGDKKAVLGENTIKLIQSDTAMKTYEDGLLSQIKSDPRYGHEPFSINYQNGVELGGQRASGNMWDQLKNPLNPKYADTWKAATNELTWLLRHANVNATAVVDQQGQITVNYTLTDTLDLRPQSGRNDAYNTITTMLGTIYHDLAGATELPLTATWTGTYP